jgi:Cdc6-like AAA superfamily ATPase
MALWKPFRKEFDDYMVGFRKHQKRVEKEAGLAHMIEAAKTREIEKANRQLQKHNDRINKRHKFLASLNTVSYEAQHHKTFRQRYTGTLSWIPAHPRYTDWLGTPSSECLCCFGIPGSGKSVVASTVVDELYQAYQGPRTLICYYYCNYKDTSSLDPSFLVGSLIKQALVHIPLEDSDYLYDTTATEHSPIDRQNLLLRLFRHYSKVFVVLDGIDELNREGQTVVLDLINLWTLTSQPVMKIFVTSRTEDFGVRDRLKSHKSFDILGSNVEEDIIAYIEGTLRQTALQNNPVLANAGLRQKIADALVYGAKGMSVISLP